MRRAGRGARRSAAGVPGDPHHRHQRQGLGRPHGHRAAAGRRACRSAPTPARTSSASTSGIAWNGEPIADDELGRGHRRGRRGRGAGRRSPRRYFEILTAAAFRWFADVAVDVAVIEVGHARPLRRHQRRRRHGRRAHQRRPRPHRRRRARGGRRSPRRRSASSSPAATFVLRRDRPGAARRSSPRHRPPRPGGGASDFDCDQSIAGARRPARRPAHARRHGRRRLPAAPRRAPGRQRRHRPGRGRGVLRPSRSTRTSCAEAFAARHACPAGSRSCTASPRSCSTPPTTSTAPRACAATLAEEFTLGGSLIMVVGLLAGPRPGRDARGARRPRRRLPRRLHARLAPGDPGARGRGGRRRRSASSPRRCPRSTRRCDRALALASPDDFVLVTGSLYVVGPGPHRPAAPRSMPMTATDDRALDQAASPTTRAGAGAARSSSGATRPSTDRVRRRAPSPAA